MRLRNWVTVALGCIMLAVIGTIGIIVNRSALQAADSVHRADSRALGLNNATLAAQLQLLSAAELRDAAKSRSFDLRPDDASDRAALEPFTTESSFYQYGAAITDLSGTPLTSTRTSGLRSPTIRTWHRCARS